MKDLLSVLLLCAVSPVLGEIVKVKRQSASTSTSSVFSVPTPSSLPTVNSSEYDLSKHFCRLWRHQSKLVVGSAGLAALIDSLQAPMLMARYTSMAGTR
jgi:hypothetical protein